MIASLHDEQTIVRDILGSHVPCIAVGALSSRDGLAPFDRTALAADTEPLPLTGREREIVMLIGEGLSNREIAARLTISPRTVENHIFKAMAKTGTASRDELANLLRRHDST